MIEGYEDTLVGRDEELPDEHTSEVVHQLITLLMMEFPDIACDASTSQQALDHTLAPSPQLFDCLQDVCHIPIDRIQAIYAAIITKYSVKFVLLLALL